MILTCPACQTRYQADASKFPPQGRDVRCARCGYTWHQVLPEPEPDIFAATPEPPTPPDPPSYQPAAPQPGYYAEPPVRDEEPQFQEETAEPSQEPSRSPWPRRLYLGAGWLVWIAAVVAIGLAAVIFREQIVQAWPRSASAYAAIGLKVDIDSLRIGAIKWREKTDGRQIIGTLTGVITNVTDRELAVPQIRAALLDGEKHDIYHWVFMPNVMTLRPGQSMRFETRISSPPEGARDLEVRFTRTGE